MLITVMTIMTACAGGNKTIPTPTPESMPSSGLVSISLEQALKSGRPTLADFGSVTCIPCKQMKVILDDLAIDYNGKVNIVIINVYEEPDIASNYGIMAIPTQIFFDKSGRPVAKHVGLFPKEDIIVQLRKMEIE